MPQLEDWTNTAFLTALRLLKCPGAESPIIHRHDWQSGMCLLALEAQGKLGAGRVGLSVAAGSEQLMYLLTERVDRLTAIDLYTGKYKGDMLFNPEKYAMIPFVRERLTVRSMNATKLEFDDDTFDFVYSIGPSLNYFCGKVGAVSAMNEMYRVLRNDGVAVVATEFILGEQNHEAFYNKIIIMTDLLNKIRLQPISNLDFALRGFEHLNPGRFWFSMPDRTIIRDTSSTTKKSTTLILNSRIASRHRKPWVPTSVLANLLNPFLIAPLLLVLRKGD